MMAAEISKFGHLRRVVEHFPSRQLRMVFGYGSGVFQQEGHADMAANMLDFVFVVDQATEWHQANLQQNPGHYSFLRHIGAHRISLIQERLGARMYFNTLVPCDGRLIKYGVISTKNLLDDLLDWETLYASGRLHKPVAIVHYARSHELSTALVTNLQSAVHTALLMLSDVFSEEELFKTITSLSYSGDFRMTVGEDKNKVANIVRPNLDRFRSLYETILDSNPHLFWNKSKGTFEQSLSPSSRFHHLNLLPKMLQINIVGHRNRDGRLRDTEEVIHDLAHETECSDVVNECMQQIVKRSSLTQSLKGLLTAGFVKSAKYSYSKLIKMWKSQQKPDKSITSGQTKDK